MRQKRINELLELWFIFEVGNGPNKPVEVFGTTLCTPVVVEGRDELFAFFYRLFRSLISRATPIASVNKVCKVALT